MSVEIALDQPRRFILMYPNPGKEIVSFAVCGHMCQYWLSNLDPLCCRCRVKLVPLRLCRICQP